VQELMAQ
jgi:hypothetical protein